MYETTATCKANRAKGTNGGGGALAGLALTVLIGGGGLFGIVALCAMADRAGRPTPVATPVAAPAPAASHVSHNLDGVGDRATKVSDERVEEMTERLQRDVDQARIRGIEADLHSLKVQAIFND